MVIDTYGIPSYREANPALVTIITFPFFFGMMFGDMGHGSIVLTFAILATLFPSMFKGGFLEPVLYARYLLLFMGIMAFYCGFIYNEWFAIPTNFFGSCYDININKSGGESLQPITMKETPPNAELKPELHEDVTYVYRRHNNDCVYFFG